MGSDSKQWKKGLVLFYFNPRSRMGSDEHISSRYNYQEYFNPRSRMGSDDKTHNDADRHQHFNPRSRMGSDAYHDEEVCAGQYFNPRSRMGSDLLNALLKILCVLFQSTLPHGERREHRRITEEHSSISIHAPAWGATDEDFCHHIHHKHFNPRSRMGSDER